MARYTMELRELISTFGEDEVKSWFNQYSLSDYLTPEEIQVIEERGVWSQAQLTQRIIDHFFLREIGQDSPGAFILVTKDLMNEIMETYAPIIYSASLKYDPLVNVNYSETLDRTTGNTGSSTGTTSTNGSSLGVNSDTPQGEISKSEILGGKYASSTSASESDSSTSDTRTNQDNGTEHYVRTTKGNSGVSATSQSMIKQYREIIRAINTEIVYKLEPLFMGLY